MFKILYNKNSVSKIDQDYFFNTTTELGTEKCFHVLTLIHRNMNFQF